MPCRTLTIGDHVDREGDRPSQRYRLKIIDQETQHTVLWHQPMDSFAGYPGESRTYNQFRPYRWYVAQVQPMARVSATNAPDYDYIADVDTLDARFTVEKLDSGLLFATHSDRSADWFEQTALFRFVPRLIVDLDGVNSNGTEVADETEVDPGVVLVDGWTKLRIQDPWTNNPPAQGLGTFTLSWTNPTNKWIKLNGLDSPVSLSCNPTGWPTNFTVTRSGNWVDWLDSVVVTLSHSVSTETDQVRLGQVTRPVLTAYRAGANFGSQVTAEDKASNDASLVVLLVNNDRDDGLANGQRDNEDLLLNPGAEADDDPIRVRLFRPDIVPDKGLLFIASSDGYAVRLFQDDGNALATNWVDMAAPAGYLAALTTNTHVDVWVEGLEPCRDLVLTYGYQGMGGSQGLADELHVRVVEVTLTDDTGSEISELTILPREYLTDWGISGNPLLADFPQAFYRMRADGLRSDEIAGTRMYSQSVPGDYYDDTLAGGSPEDLSLGSDRLSCIYHGNLLSEAEKGQILTNRDVNVVHNEGGDYRVTTARDTGKWKIDGVAFRHLPLGTSVVASETARWGVYVPTKWGGTLTVGCASTSTVTVSDFKRWPDANQGYESWNNGSDVGYGKQGLFTFLVTGTDYTVTNSFVQEAAAKRKVPDGQGGWSTEEYTPWNFWFFPKADSNSLNSVGDNLFDNPGPLTKFDSYFGAGCNSYAWECNTNNGHRKIWVPGIPSLMDDGHCMDAALASAIVMQPSTNGVTNNWVGFSQEDLEGICTEFFTKGRYGSPMPDPRRPLWTHSIQPTNGHANAVVGRPVHYEAENDSKVHIFYDALRRGLFVRHRPVLLDLRGYPPYPASGWNQACYKFRAELQQDPETPDGSVYAMSRIIRFTVTFWCNEDMFPSTGSPSAGAKRVQETVFRLIFTDSRSGEVAPDANLLGLNQDWQSMRILEDVTGVLNPPATGYVTGNIGLITDETDTHWQVGETGQNPHVTYERLLQLGLQRNIWAY